MHAPIRSDSDLVRFTLAATSVVALSVLIGWLAEPLMGVAVLVIAALLAAALFITAYCSTVSQDRPLVRRRPAEKPDRRDAVKRKRPERLRASNFHRPA